MTLTKGDIIEIRTTILEALDVVVNPRFDRIETQLDEHSAILNEHTQILSEHSAILSEHSAILNEHTQILSGNGHRLTSIEQTLGGHGHRLTAIEGKLDDVNGKLQALEADVKELYALVGTVSVPFDKKFAKLPPEERVVKLHDALLLIAEQLHVEL